MKKLLLSFVVLPGALAIAQVGINTDTPKATLDISAKDNQEGGDLRIEGVKEGKSTQWLLIWDEEDQKVKRRSLLEIKRKTLNEIRIDYIREKQPTKADKIINKIKQCAPENILYDKHFGDGKHDFVYCATTVSEGGYNKTWLNLNLGAEYANIHSPHFDPAVSKTGTDAHDDDKTYGSLYQWARASDGHEFRGSETTTDKATSWTDTGSSAGKFITGRDYNDDNWVIEFGGISDSWLWEEGGDNNPCPSGYHVPTEQEWRELHQVVTGSRSEILTDKMMTQTKLPNLATAGYRHHVNGSLTLKGYVGYYWSSSTYGNINAYYMDFNEGGSDMEAFIYRDRGKSVRCIKD